MRGPAIQSGEALEAAGDFLGAAAAYESALADADRLVVADAHFHLGRVSWRQSRFEAAEAQYGVARAISIELGASELRARIENGLGAIHYARGEYEQARACYGLALELTSDATQQGRVLLNLGAIANIQGDLEAARASYARSRAYFQQTGYVRGEAMALHNLGMLLADQELWDEADESYERCLALFEHEGDRQYIAHLLLNRAEVACGRQRPDDAIANCDLALAIYGEIGDDAGRGEALRWKGIALSRTGRLDEAERALTDAIRIARRTQGKLLEAESRRELGETLAARGNHEASRRMWTRAIALFRELGASRDLAELAERVASSSSE